MGWDWKKIFEKKEDGKKPDYFSILFPVVLLCAVIILLMTNTNKNIPDTKQGETSSQPGLSLASYAEELEKKLSEAFSKMAGVGRVQVYITLSGSGEETVLKDEGKKAEDIREETSGTIRTSQQTDQEETTIKDNNGNPYIVSSTFPEVKGVLIVAEGASSAVVREQLLKAASTLLGLSYQQIQVATYQS